MKDIQDLFVFEETDLHDLHDRLWYEYFTPLKPHTKADANFIRLQANAVAAAIKIEYMDKPNGTYQEVKLIEPKDKFEMDELGPNWKKKIYVDTAEPLAITTSFNTRAKKISAAAPKGNPNAGPKFTDEDDLLGDTKPKKQKAAPLGRTKVVEDMLGDKPTKAKAGGNYDTIAALAAKGKTKDEIEKITKLPRKTITDNLWRYNKTLTKKK